MPWRDDLEKLGMGSHYAIGLREDHGVVVPQPPVVRTPQMAAATAMTKAGPQI